VYFRLQEDGDVAHPLHTRDGILSSVAPGLTCNLMVQDPSGMAGKLSPSQSEPDLANALRRRSQRRVPTEFAASSSLERTLEDQHEQPLPTMEGVHSFPSRYGLHLEALFATGFLTLKNIVVFVNCLSQLWSFMAPFVFTLICQLQLKRATVLQSGVSTHSVCQFSACGI
jgi:hypothetical protein